MEYNPLVSIGILTYNSSKYIVDALGCNEDNTGYIAYTGKAA